MRGSRGGDRGFGPPAKLQKLRISKQYWSGSPEKSQSYQARIQCWIIIGTPAKRHLNGVLLAVDDGLQYPPPSYIKKQTKKKTLSK